MLNAVQKANFELPLFRYGKSELAQNASNIFGMKCSLSGNTWSGSSWDGKSKYTKKCADQNLGYKVFDADGKVVYEPKAAEPAVKVPFLVKVSIKDLNIRKGPGTDFDRVRFIEPGVYTIMEVRSGKGSSAGWGRLKSGIGWLSLDYCKRV